MKYFFEISNSKQHKNIEIFKLFSYDFPFLSLILNKKNRMIYFIYSSKKKKEFSKQFLVLVNHFCPPLFKIFLKEYWGKE